MTAASPRSLAKLCAGLPAARLCGGADRVKIRAISTDSRAVRPGTLFVCLRGAQHDGHAFVPKAVRDGAVAAVAEHPLRHAIPTIQVPDARLALAHIASAFWGYPSRFLDVAGVTGTNGKTTVAYMLESVLAAAGLRPALLGTVDYRFGSRHFPHVHTTPEAHELQGLFAQVLKRGAKSVAMEVSSHALALHRVAGTFFRAGIFTNLTRDHLDFHGNMGNYLAAKGILFEQLPPSEMGGVAVINAESPAAGKLARLTKARVIKYGTKPGAGREVWASRVRAGVRGTTFILHLGSTKSAIRMPLIGAYNVQNALAAAGAAYGMGLDPACVRLGLARLRRVPGRLERVRLSASFAVLVDYAHTPDALARALRAAGAITEGRVICVFGCGGNRDRGKRPRMGAIASRLADFCIVTSDNPRNEDPEGIIRDILRGIRARNKHAVEPDRRKAIAIALSAARSKDTVLIAGKGHETVQIVGNRRLPFDDSKVARREWRRLVRS